MVEKDREEKRREKNLISIIKEKISDLRTGAITIFILVVLAYIGSLFAKSIITKIMAIDVIIIVTSAALGIAGLIILIIAYVIIRWIGKAVNRYCKDKGF